MGKQKLFFSYSRNDATSFATQLAKDLEQDGFDIWIDQQDIPAGRNWDIEIEKALENCDCLLFIESEKSVASNNVLDEVYYALGQNKKVIPVIYHDSKTPFRLRRLQHIDFTKDYSSGLANLLAELRGQKLPHTQRLPHDANSKFPGLLKKYLIPMLLIALLGVAGLVVLFRSNQPEKKLDSTTIPLTPNTETKANDLNRDTTLKTAETVRIARPVAESPVAKNAPAVAAKSQKLNLKHKAEPTMANSVQMNSNTPLKFTPDDIAGQWQLVNVLPKPASHRGYIKIEVVSDDRIKLVSSFQFYFRRPKTEAFFSVFNGFASCSNCALKKEIVVPEKDISFGTQRYTILKTDVAGEGNAGDTTADIGGNSTVPASVVIKFADARNAIIKVAQPRSTPISNDFVVPPFVYEFYFQKNL